MNLRGLLITPSQRDKYESAMAALRAENQELKAENRELKKQLQAKGGSKKRFA